MPTSQECFEKNVREMVAQHAIDYWKLLYEPVPNGTTEAVES